MKARVWTCDRCGTTVAVPYATLIVEEWSPKAIRSGFGPQDPESWEEFSDDETVTDVCPTCVTDVERADRLFREVEADVLLGANPEDA